MRISEPAEYIILGLLTAQTMHGYEMFQQFENGTPGQIVHLEMSQMYAFLKKLERLHYIEAEIEQQGIRPPRKIYHLTKAGHDVFTQWLVEPAEKPRDIRILFLIKLYFVQLYMPQQTQVLLEKQLQACQRFLNNLQTRKEQESAHKGETTFFDHVVLSSRIHQTQALLDWMHELQKEFKSHVLIPQS
jgi:DNA-binding PadR family transcriptional regulator